MEVDIGDGGVVVEIVVVDVDFLDDEGGGQVEQKSVELVAIRAMTNFQRGNNWLKRCENDEEYGQRSVQCDINF